MYMTLNETLSKIDKIFEDGITPLASVPTEPVASGLMATVTSKLTGIWSNPGLSKYRKVTHNEVESAYTKSYDKAIKGSEQIKRELHLVNEVDPSIMPGNVSNKTKAVVSEVAETTGLKIDQIKKMLLEIFQEVANLKATMPADKRAKAMLKLVGRVAANYKLKEQDINTLMYLIWEDGSQIDITFGDLVKKVSSSTIGQGTAGQTGQRVP